jgi:hypothetical protein
MKDSITVPLFPGGCVVEKVSYLDISAAKKRLEETSSDAAIDHLYDFAKVLVDEVQQRTSQIDGKLVSILGWTAGILALILVGQDSWLKAGVPFRALMLYLASASTICAMGGVLFAFLGLRTRGVWSFPSEADWFRDELIGNPRLLKKYHTLGLLEAHQEHNKVTSKKAAMLFVSEWLLAASAILVGTVILIQIIPKM